MWLWGTLKEKEEKKKFFFFFFFFLLLCFVQLAPLQERNAGTSGKDVDVVGGRSEVEEEEDLLAL